MGYAIAEAACRMGASVELVSGPVSLSAPSGVNLHSVETTEEMHRAVKKLFRKSDVLIMAAAPADYRLTTVASQKIKKTGEALSLQLSPTVDILKDLSKSKREKQIVVGFALETENGVDNARRKLKEKSLDLIVLNHTTQSDSAFDADDNIVTILQPGRKPEEWPRMEKKDVALRLMHLVASKL